MLFRVLSAGKSLKARADSLTTWAHSTVTVNLWANNALALFVVGSVFLAAGLTKLCFADDGNAGPGPGGGGVKVDTSAIDEATCWLYYFQEGPYGALLLAVTGIGALVSCAVGAYRASLNCLTVALGSWLIRPVATLLFEYDIADCGGLTSARAPSGFTP